MNDIIDVSGGIITGAVSVIVYRVIDCMLTPKIKGWWRFLLIFAIILALAALISLIMRHVFVSRCGIDGYEL